MNESINLLDPNKKTISSGFLRRMQVMRVITGGLLFIVSVSSVILFILVALSPLPSLQKQEQSLRLTLSQSKDDIVKLALINERTATVNNIITKRQSLDQTLALIQSKLSNDTTITAIQADKQSMTLTAESPSLQSLDNFLNGLMGFVQNKKSFSQVTLVDLTNDQANNQYAVTVRLTLL